MCSSGTASYFRADAAESTDDDGFTKGLIVSFVAKTAGPSGTENTEEAVPTEGAQAAEEELTREAIKGALAKFGVIRVCLHSEATHSFLSGTVVSFG
jgi:hypothetical protein